MNRTVRIILAWAIIVTSVAVMARSAYQASEFRHGLPVVSEFQTEMMSRYAMGIKQVIKSPEFTGTLSTTVQADADQPLDRVRLIPVMGDLQDSQTAVKYADDLLSQKLPDDLRKDAELFKSIYAGQSVSPDDLQALRDKYGFFGDVAAAHMQGPGSALQAQIDRETLRTFLAVASMAMILLGAFISGLVLLIVFAVIFFDGRMRPRLAPAGPDTATVMVEAFAIYLLCMTIFSEALGRFEIRNIAVETLLVVPVALAIGWAWLRLGGARLREAVGWNSGHGLFREIGAGIVGYISGIPVMAIGFLITSQLMKFAGGPEGHTTVDHPIIYALLRPGFSRIFLIFLACVFAPIVEELMFRGLLLGHLRGFFGWFISAAITSFIFAAIHPQGWEAIPVLGSLAMILAALREQRESLIPNITAHALNNTIVLTFLLVAMG